jgi:outer membrane protein OmpA-like peptidoglycan-associated protein
LLYKPIRLRWLVLEPARNNTFGQWKNKKINITECFPVLEPESFSRTYPLHFMKKSFFSLLAAATLLASCETKHSETKDQLAEAGQDTAVMARDGKTVADAASSAGAAINNAWDMGKAKLADVKFKEITLPGVSVRGDSTYNVYSVDEKVLFDTNKADIKPGAAEALKQITGSINQRYNASQVRVMGFADSRGAKDYNKDLSEKRAEAVKNYLVANGHIAAARVSVEPMGEAMPAASNATAAGRQENRRVEIAVRTR